MQNLVTIIRNANINLYPNTELNNKIAFAIRGEYKDVNVGDILKPSYEWIDNERTNNQLSGTCACKLIEASRLDDYEDDELISLIKKTINNAKKYGNEKLVLVYGLNTEEVANDFWANEVILDDCQVLAIISE